MIYGSIPVTLNSTIITFRDSIQPFNLDGDLLKTMTNYKFNVAHSNPQNLKVIYKRGKVMNFNINQVG